MKNQITNYVSAVNAHYKLVEACKKALLSIELDLLWQDSGPGKIAEETHRRLTLVRDSLTAAITLAEGGKGV